MNTTLLKMSVAGKNHKPKENVSSTSESKLEQDTNTQAKTNQFEQNNQQKLQQRLDLPGKHQTAQQHHSLATNSLQQNIHNLTHQLNSAAISTTTATTLQTSTLHPPTLPHQLRTVATIHQHRPRHQKSIQPNVVQSTDISSVENSTAPTSTLQPHQLTKKIIIQTDGTNITLNNNSTNTTAQRNFGQTQTLKLASDIRAPAHCIPPRYLPPPQPITNRILKHVNTLTSGPSNESPSKQNLLKFSNPTRFNLKYPPDIPQLSPIHIPDSVKTQGSSSRYLQQQQPRIQRYRDAFTFSENSSNTQQHFAQNQYRQEQVEQQQQHSQEMLKFVRKTDQDHPSPNASVSSNTTNLPATGARLTAEQNRQLQSLINELRILKEQNQRLLDDNQELRDLCCFLDDDRQKGRKLAREWQRFGRYTASVMRQEVAAYQNKLRQLDDKQQELITDNLELKELCLYLDEERAHVASSTLCSNCGTAIRNPLRDDGDGSSSSTNADETISALRNFERQVPDMHLRATLNDQTLQYVRSLERRIQQLEEERLMGANPSTNIVLQQSTARVQKQKQTPQDVPQDLTSNRPEAVVRALQVLEVREQLERERLNTLTDNNIEHMDDGEKALVREMCNVVWRKLESNTPSVPCAMEQL